MTGNTRLKAVALAIYLLIIPFVLYFKLSPTIVNSPITDLLFLALLFSLAVLLVYGSFLIRKSLDVYLLLPQTLMIAFIVRAASYLKFSGTVLLDSYYHMVTTTNILSFGVANPQLSWWYYNVQNQLYWPLMHLLTATTVLTSGIDVGLVFKFQEPLLGALFVLAAFILAKLVIKSDGAALLSAIVALSAETTILFQSEYHPQGLAFVLFVFLVYAFLKLRVTKNRLMYSVFLIFLAAFVLSHHFSSLFIGLFAIVVMVTPFALMRVPRIRPEFRKLLKEVSRDYRIWLLIIGPVLAYQALGYYYFASQVIRYVMSAAHTPQVLTVGVQVPLLYTASNAVQYVFLLLAAVSLLLTVRTQDITRVRCAVLAAVFIIVGFFGNYAGALPLDRTIGFYTPLGAIFVAFTVYSIKDQWFLSVNKSLKTGLLIAVICMTLVAGVVNSQVPSVFFKDSGANPFYFSSNDLSSINRLNTSGTWINQHVDQKSRIAVEFDTQTAVFYYGRHAAFVYTEQGLSANYIKQVGAEYVVVNPSIPYAAGFNKTAYLNRIDVVYDDGRVNAGKVNTQ